MKRNIVILFLLHVTLITSAQTALSNQISRFPELYERIDFYNEDSIIVSLAPKFYRLHQLKKRVKPIKVQGQSYFIQLEKFGVQSVYTTTGEHIADMERDGTAIHFKDGITYSLRPRIKFANRNILECYNSEKELVSSLIWDNDRRLKYDNNGDQNPNLLLMALCAHQFQELLLGDRGRLTN